MDWSESGYLALSALNVKDGYIDFSQDVHYGNQELYDKWMSGKELHRGQVLFTTEAPMGNVAQVPDNKGYILSQRTIAFDVEEKILSENFLATLLRTPNVFNDLIALSSGGTAKGVSQKSLSGLDVVIPKNIDEQNKLADYFINLDNLITLHQRKCIFFTGRAGRLISTVNKKRITSSWEQRKFDEVFDCTVPNNTLSRAELSYDEGTVLNVHYGDVLIKYGSVLDVQKDDIPRIPHRCREDFNGALLQDGDVIIADTAEDETTGKACEIGNLQGSAIVSGLHTMVCRPRNRMALGYLGYYLNSNAYHHQLLPLMQGIKVLSLSRSNIQKTSVSYPIAVKEQQLIAYYFSQLDNLITLHQRELEKLQNIKKSMLEKMFV